MELFFFLKKIAAFPLNYETAVVRTSYLQEEKGVLIYNII